MYHPAARETDRKTTASQRCKQKVSCSYTFSLLDKTKCMHLPAGSLQTRNGSCFSKRVHMHARWCMHACVLGQACMQTWQDGAYFAASHSKGYRPCMPLEQKKINSMQQRQD